MSTYDPRGKDFSDHYDGPVPPPGDDVELTSEDDDEQQDEAPPVNILSRLPPPDEPMAVARSIADDDLTKDGRLTLQCWRGGWWKWEGPRWVEIEQNEIRSTLYRKTEYAMYSTTPNGGLLKRWAPNRRKIADLQEALAAVVHLSSSVAQPSWTGATDVPDGVIVACSNGLLHVPTRTRYDHDPRFFNTVAVPFAYDPDAPTPERWLRFLKELWTNDDASINALQEFCGYIISGRLDLQKMLLIVGPTRGGKGTITRVMGHLVGRENVCGPTLSSLGGDFGLAPLLGKSIAVISDARLTGRGGSVVVERLLSISGEDTLTVNRKYRDQYTGKLPVRFVILSNELPHFGDASAAIIGRFVALQLRQSWLGKEDLTLERDLERELPGILNWSLDGLTRLSTTGRFTQPDGMTEMLTTLADLASPVAAFVRDRCVAEPDQTVHCAELFTHWKEWAEDNGHRAGSAQMFGRNLRAAVAGVRVEQPRGEDGRHRRYRGIGIRRLI